MICSNCNKQINDEAKFCEFCGKPIGEVVQAEKIQAVAQPQSQTIHQVVYSQTFYQQPPVIVPVNKGYHILRLVVGIISIIMFLIVELQSCALLVSVAVNKDTSPYVIMGTFLGILFLTAGTISIGARKSFGGTIVALCFFVLCGLMSIPAIEFAGWVFFSFLFAGLLAASMVFEKTDNKNVQKF